MNSTPSATLWEDEDFLIVNKAIGVDVSQAFPPSIRAVHRLDTPVSGVLWGAKSAAAHAAAQQLFLQGRVEKLYWAITAQSLAFDQGELVHWLNHRQKGNKTRVFHEPGPGRQEARMSYRRLATGDRYLLWEILLGTGRTHQIRAQLSAAGAPIRGDLKYGFARSNPGGGISLLARRLCFEHPYSKQRLQVDARPPEPDALWAALASTQL